LEMNHQPMTVLRVIEDGIRTTYPEYNDMSERVEKVVKETELHKGTRPAAIEHTIRYGVKKTHPDKIPHEYDWSNQFTEEIDDIIQNGVKHTEYGDWEDGDERLNDIIENGVKETTPGGYLGFVEMKGKKIHQFETAKQLYYVEDVIESGIKKTISGHPDKKEFIEKVVLEHGIKETWGYEKQSQIKIDNVINNGIKDTIGLNT